MVVVGGVHATVNPKHVLKNTLADACIRGEGELPMLKYPKWRSLGCLFTKTVRLNRLSHTRQKSY